MEYLDALHEGVWEVVVPKEEVTEPLGEHWQKSPVNVPTPETIASYRNGQYHAHETKQDYRVHVDRYDPTKNPVMHLVDDAPLALMIFETLETLTVSAKDAKREDPIDRIVNLRLSGGLRMGLGALVFAIGVVLLLLAFGTTALLFEVIVPALVALAGVVTLANGIRLRARGEHAKRDVVRGLALIAGGVLLYFFWFLYAILLVLILAVWSLSSAAVTLARVVRTRGKLPQGFAFTLGLGLVSLLFAYWAFVDPARLVKILVLVLGVIMLIAGIFLVTDGYGMRNAATLIEQQAGETLSASA